MSFEPLWKQLFTSNTHLDSALSKLTPNKKSVMARVVPYILQRPTSLAQELGIGIPKGEPWKRVQERSVADWRPATLLAERMEESIRQGVLIENWNIPPLTTDFPPWMTEAWESEWGADVAATLVKSLGLPAPLSLRAARRIGAEALRKRIAGEGKLPIKSELSPISPLGIRLLGFAKVLNTPEFEEGLFEIQDEGSQLMSLFSLWPERFASVLAEKPGQALSLTDRELPARAAVQSVIDACAGAGGKTLALADLLGGRGRVYAYDTVAGKLQALRRRATRAGYNSIQAVVLEEGAEDKTVSKFEATADMVLVDAPCSGWGVLRRNPDIKWRQLPEELDKLPELQLRLLSTYSRLVKPGGRLVFGVCTFRHAETRRIVERFNESFPGFEPREGGFLGPAFSDGFFMQSWQRK